MSQQYRISLNVCTADDCTGFGKRSIDESFVTEMEQEMTIVSASRDFCHAQERLNPCNTFPCKNLLCKFFHCWFYN